MGRRKKKNYQSISEIQSDLAYDRMAGDPLMQDALDYLANNPTSESYVDAAIQDAMEFLPRRRQELRSLESKEEDLMNLGELRGGTPAPVQKFYGDGSEDRIHTRYSINPVTGQTEVVPFTDSDGMSAVRTALGKLNIHPMTKGGKDPTAHEIVGVNILKLMDKPSKFNSGHYSEADALQKQSDGNISKIDLMIADRGVNRFGDSLDKTVAIPRYTNLYPLSQQAKQAGVKKAVDELKRLGYSTESAVEYLVSRGHLGPSGNDRHGKLHKGNRSYVNTDSGMYDSLLISGYDVGLTKGKTPEAVRFKSDRYAYAPESIHLLKNINNLRNDIEAGNVSSKMIAATNYGVDGQRHERKKILEIVNQNDSNFVDVTKKYPHTEQLLKNLPLV